MSSTNGSEGGSSIERMLTTSEVAERLAVSAEFVRDHAGELGAIRIGGERGPLRFDPADVAAYVERRRLAGPTKRPRQRPGPKRAPADVELLPIPERRL